MNKKLGLFRLIPFSDKDHITSDLNVIFEDIYDALEGTRENVRDLEAELDIIFYGENYGKEIAEERSKKSMSRIFG